VSMSNPTNFVEVITSVQRRRRWTASEKVRVDPTQPCGKYLFTGLSDDGLGLSHPFSHPKRVSRYIAAREVSIAARGASRLRPYTPYVGFVQFACLVVLFRRF
jgi:hypothetical protein